MKKMLAMILLSCFTFSGHCLDQYNQNLKELKKEINEVFKITDLDHLQAELDKVFAKIHPAPDPALKTEFKKEFKKAITEHSIKTELTNVFKQANPPVDLKTELNTVLTRAITNPALNAELERKLKARPEIDLKTELNDVIAKTEPHELQKAFNEVLGKTDPHAHDLAVAFGAVFKRATDASDLEKEFERVFTDDSVVDSLQKALNDIFGRAANKTPALQEEFNKIFANMATDPNLRIALNEVFFRATTDLKLRQEFDEVLERPIYLITVTRSSKKNKDPYNGIAINNLTMISETEMKNVLQEVENKINGKYKDDYKIIAFNEMFFSKKTPLDKNGGVDSVTHDSVLKCIKDFNKDVKNSIVFYNVLYKSEENIDWQNALYLYALTFFRQKNGSLNYEFKSKKSMSDHVWTEINKRFSYTTPPGKTVVSIIGDYVNKYKKSDDTFSYNDLTTDTEIKTITSTEIPKKAKFLVNRTYCIYDQKDIFYYNKSAYYRENDDLIDNHKYIYLIGDGYPENRLPNIKHDKIFNAISTEICLDFACGIRKNNLWKNKRGGVPSKLHIIQSNSVNTWFPSSENYPFDIPILYSDANYDFPNLRVAFGGGIHCIKLNKTEQIKVNAESKEGTLYKLVEKIQFKRNSSHVDVDDHYTIWVHKI
jgi:hypothetical protein